MRQSRNKASSSSPIPSSLAGLNLAIEWVPDSDSEMENTTILPHNMADSRTLKEFTTLNLKFTAIMY
ncbi:hypothetical protein FNV43_RR02076 [Rhamnella rubrinervis]|uniref:Uncharacterized protein n=1 Tax=Rhamnella rubrinervis TaxID=2594499 RepID=A0A8K0MTI7_9ROSA|nr:hypothetical protein FNV43_RR02076 [Rhamnella rubrinervis]